MLEALKRLYSLTFCVLCLGSKMSRKFQTYTGIRQGALSSTLLFIIFIDDLINVMKARCVEEPLIGILHCLLHADDTAIISTNRDKFQAKCNVMLEYFRENSLSLNLSKSAYLIINGKKCDPKSTLKLDNGILEYKSRVIYLGAVISDSGSLKSDVKSYTKSKRPNLTIKFNNFCKKHHLAPLEIKLMVLNTCVTASILYDCETWGDNLGTHIETMYRQGIKSALSVRESTNNEIVYIETGLYPLFIRVKKQQMNFWNSIQNL